MRDDADRLVCWVVHDVRDDADRLARWVVHDVRDDALGWLTGSSTT
jgi:hypothetical protein